MATILLSAAGAAIGGSLGGSVLGLSATAIGRFAGATLGRAIDQRLLGPGSEVVETGRLDRLRLTGVGEGEPVAQVFGRMRVPGHVIWASAFEEHMSESGGGSGKGGPRAPTTRSYSYSVSLALALCEGEITSVGRVWADGVEIGAAELGMTVYTGAPDQGPDPLMEAIEGQGAVPAYRGTAYVVIEDLQLARFGNRVPQFTFEVMRPVQANAPGASHEMPWGIKGVALMPGSGEYALASSQVFREQPDGQAVAANVNTPSGESDMLTSLRALSAELPNCEATSLIVSWFGSDLRCAECEIRPKVEQTSLDGDNMPWESGGVSRAQAMQVPLLEGRPVYGGTPSDASVLEAIAALREAGQKVMFYPFILMDQMPGNALPDPWGEAEQARLPWRGRITTALAPGQPGTTDGTAQAEAEVAAFFGTASASDFTISAAGGVVYSGPDEWSLRRFILHNAALCAAAGGVEAFCIGSEMRALTQIRGANASFPAVAALRALAGEARALLGPDVLISYAADWSEYFGYAPQDGSGDRYFHLDPLWADPEIDFIGIDNYMRISDWRDGDDHADAHWGSLYNLEYLKANIAGGEGYDWYYASEQDRANQIRTPITDAAHSEPWVHRYKDIANWWRNPHYERVNGTRAHAPTVWVPESKPIWFTEIGCAAIDKGTNQPNKFLDPKSSESRMPNHSSGERDELMQLLYLRAMSDYWSDPANNPRSQVYDAPMITTSRSFVWAWDARPYPFFPARDDVWSDGANYAHGHWITGRSAGRSLAGLVAEICQRAGLAPTDFNVENLHGYVRGYAIAQPGDARAALQPLMLAHGFDAVEREGVLHFLTRLKPFPGRAAPVLAADELVESDEVDGGLEIRRAGEAELAGRVRLRFMEADGDFEVQAEEAVMADEATHAVSESELALSLTRAEAQGMVRRWLRDARIARETARLALPLSRLAIGAGDLVRLPVGSGAPLYRIDRVETAAGQLLEAARVEPEPARQPRFARGTGHSNAAPATAAATRVAGVFLDLPLIRGDEAPHAPYLAIGATPWRGDVALYSATDDEGFRLNTVIGQPALMGITQTPLNAASAGQIDRGPGLEVRLLGANARLESISTAALLGGANLMAIGHENNPDHWELLQFRDAHLLPSGNYRLSHRLRGQAGSDGIMPQQWPTGARVVMLGAQTPRQITLSAQARGVARRYRFGWAGKGYEDPSYREQTHAFNGNGQRPYRPCHLRAKPDGTGGLTLTWIRRTRIEGDGWQGIEVPLGEESEAYLVQVWAQQTLLRETVCASPNWHYPASQRAQDLAAGAQEIRVAQISANFGPGPAARLTPQ